MSSLRFVFTKHAEEMLRQRNIEREWVERAVRSPLLLEADEARPATYRAFITIAERQGRTLRVVFVREGDIARIVTAFLDRGRKL